MKRLIMVIGLCILANTLFAFEIPFDGVSASISTTTATLFSYPCYIDGMAITNQSGNQQLVTVYDNTTEVYRCIISSNCSNTDINFKKRITSKITAKASITNLEDNMRLYIGIR